MKGFFTALLTLLTLSLSAQFNYPTATPTWFYRARVASPDFDTTGNSAISYPGLLQFRQAAGDTGYYFSTGRKYIKVGSGSVDLSKYWDSITTKANFPIDTVQTVELMEFYTGKALLMVVTDPQRGGLFRRNKNFSFGNEITRYPNIFGDVWDRVFDPANGIHLDWAPLDPTGATDASAALKSVFALPYKKFVGGSGSRYRLDDSIRIENKDSLIVDFNGATIYENTVSVRTLVFHGCNALTIRNVNFDGAQTYASFQANTPTIFRSYLRVDSCENAVIEGVRSKNKQGVLSIGKAYKAYINNIDHIGFMDATHKANANYCPAIQVEHDGYDVVTRWNGYTRINNVHSRDGGSALLIGDDAQYYTITNIQGSNLFDNGIYVSSAFYAAINGCIFRNAGSTGIKARGRGFTITGNVITNSQVGIVVTGNSDQADPFFGPPVNEFGSTGYGTVVSGNVIDSVSAKGISIEQMEPAYTCNDITVNGNVIMHHTGTTNQYALQVSTVAAATVIGNKIYSSTGTSAVFINNKTGDSTQHNEIANNIVHGCTGIGVTFSGVKKSIIEGNRFFDVAGNAMLFQNCSGNQVINNYADGLIYNASAANNNTRNVFMLNRGSSSTTDNANNAVLWNLPNIQQGVTNRPWFTGSTTVSSNIPYIAMDTVSASNWSRISLFWQLNGLSGAAQALATGTSGTDINWNSTGTTHTLNVPTSSSTARGALSSADWTTFNNKAPGSGSVNYVNINPASLPQGGSFNISDTATVAKTGKDTFGPYFRLMSGTKGAALQMGDPTASESTLQFWTTNNGGGPGGTTFGERMRIGPSGVSIGTTTNLAALTVGSFGGNSGIATTSATGGSLRFSGSAGNMGVSIGTIYFGNTGQIQALSPANWITGVSTPTYLNFSTTQVGSTTLTERMRITDSGNVAINKITASAKLDVNGDVAAVHYKGNSATPTFTPNGATNSILGTGYSLTITGNDAHMIVTITTGTGITTSGTIGSIVFAQPYGVIPTAVSSPGNVNALAAHAVSVNCTNGNDMLLFSSANLSPSTDYIYNIITGQ